MSLNTESEHDPADEAFSLEIHNLAKRIIQMVVDYMKANADRESGWILHIHGEIAQRALLTALGYTIALAYTIVQPNMDVFSEGGLDAVLEIMMQDLRDHCAHWRSLLGPPPSRKDWEATFPKDLKPYSNL